MKVLVKTPARLHLGMLDLSGDLGRIYGGIGVAIERPKLLLEAEPASELLCQGLEAERVENYARRFLECYPLPYGAHLTLKSSIPAHVGLGSGTQLALAVGTALARMGGLKLNVPEIAASMRRGLHSGIGTAVFRYGGFVLDGGHRLVEGESANSIGHEQVEQVPPVLFHYSVPRNWYFVIGVPQTDPGLSGEKELRAFRTLQSKPAELAEKIARLVLMKMLPALVEADIDNFGSALTEIQRLVGDSFASVQGGRYANRISAQLIAHLLERGVAGAGQSSWGPAVYALLEGEEPALQLENDMKEFLDRNGGGMTFCVRADNRGAQVERE